MKYNKYILILIIISVIGLFTGCNNKKDTATEIKEMSSKKIEVSKFSPNEKEIRFNVFGELSKEDVKSLAKKVYSKSYQDNWLAGKITFNVVKPGTTITDSFYVDGLTKVIINKEKTSYQVITYDKVNGISKGINNIKYSIADAKEDTGTLKVQVNMTEGISQLALIQQTNYLAQSVKDLNPNKKIDSIEFDINPNSNLGYGYSTQFKNILAVKETFKLE